MNYQQEARDRYFYLRQQAEQQEVCIEEAMLAHERDLIPIEKVVRVNKQGVNIKYKAEVANQHYKASIEKCNEII